MNMKIYLSSFVAAVISIVSVVDAFSSGSPVCTIGEPALQSTHLTRQTVMNGTLSRGTFQVSISNSTLNSTIVNTVPSNTSLPVILSSTSGVLFRGVLIILNHPNTSLSTNFIISPNSTDLKPQAQCAPANFSGFTHTNNTLKSTARFAIILPSNQAAFLDVNVVVINSGVTNTSIYYYTRYQLKGAAAVAPPSVPAPVPFSAPVPITAPVPVPVTVPIPVTAPLPVPGTPPVLVSVPVTRPINKPLNQITKNPFCDVLNKRPTKKPAIPGAKAPRARKNCGPLGFNILCSFTICTIFGSLLRVCKE
jgi:hypothetical protein